MKPQQVLANRDLTDGVDLPSVKLSGRATPLVLVWESNNWPLVNSVNCSNPKQIPKIGK